MRFSISDRLIAGLSHRTSRKTAKTPPVVASGVPMGTTGCVDHVLAPGQIADRISALKLIAP
jgi:hypothetical protein